MRHALPLAALIALAACSEKPKVAEEPRPAAGVAPATPQVDPAQPAGTYYLDPAHSTVTFRVSHIGMSQYVASFGRIDGTLQLDPRSPESASVQVTIDPRSLVLPAPPAGFKDTLMDAAWFDAGRCPQMTFRSTKVTRTGSASADIAGDLTLKCVTRPLTLKAVFNGGYPPNDMDPNGARVGFSALVMLKRSDFGMGYGIPAPGSNMGVGDEVAISIETEFTSRKDPASQPAQ
jgi:polyisoprenoid-binding protein YceI